MPIYRYQCESLTLPKPEPSSLDSAIEALKPCEHEYEVFYSSIPRAEAEEGEEPCPKCGGKDKKRLISTGTSHTLKGKGWFYNGGY